MDPIHHWVDIAPTPEELYAAVVVCAVVGIIVRVRRTLRKSKGLK